MLISAFLSALTCDLVRKDLNPNKNHLIGFIIGSVAFALFFLSISLIKKMIIQFGKN